jgi:hypothetical protein
MIHYGMPFCFLFLSYLSFFDYLHIGNRIKTSHCHPEILRASELAPKVFGDDNGIVIAFYFL